MIKEIMNFIEFIVNLGDSKLVLTLLQQNVNIQLTAYSKFQITRMSKSNSARISFAGLKNERNKQNDVCFQNLRTNAAQNSFTGNSHYHSYSNKNTIIAPQRKTTEDHQQNLFTSSRFTNAIKQLHKANLYRKKNQSAVQQAYERAQKSIKQQISQYNHKFTEINEMLADLHIKDLMKFNQAMEKNQMLYQRYIDLDISIEDKNIFNQANVEDLRKIKQIEKTVLQIINDKNKSFDFRSTFQSRHNKTTSGHSSRVSPQLVLEINSPFKATKKSSANFDRIGQSVKSQLIGDSRSSKLDSLQQNKKRVEQALQDTPESVKSKISCTTSKLKTQKTIQIGMFDRINVCESIQHFEPVEQKTEKQPNQSFRSKRDNRYGRSSQQ